MPLPVVATSGLIARYRDRLPVPEGATVISLGEGDTPLLRSAALSEMVQAEVYLKFEGSNPTGSFKDRGMTVAVTAAAAAGVQVLLCASTGNTSASAAAYAARAGIRCAVVLPAGRIARGKLLQARMHGARIVALDGNFDDALRLVQSVGRRPGVCVVNSTNPDRIAGQKTIAFEVIEQLGAAPDFHLLPVGNAGNITAHWQGYLEAGETAGRRPRLLGFQAAGAAPIYHNRVISKPETVATAIRIGHPASWESARAAVRESEGAIDIVTDEEILEAQQWLAGHDGLFAEPASAAPVAGLLKAARAKTDLSLQLRGRTIVCTITGHGLKDPEVETGRLPDAVPAAPEETDLLRALEL